MSGINLDPSRLLGFKIIAEGESTSSVSTPKIGVKPPPSPGIGQAVPGDPLVAEVGSKAD